MFDGEKTALFWIGLIILGFASVFSFGVIWFTISGYMNYLYYSHEYPSSYASYAYVWSYVPIFVGGIVFMLIGLYMMKSGVRKKQALQPKIPLLPNAS
jgi:hypothetical protein